jgi:hypothetical protein
MLVYSVVFKLNIDAITRTRQLRGGEREVVGSEIFLEGARRPSLNLRGHNRVCFQKTFMSRLPRGRPQVHAVARNDFIATTLEKSTEFTAVITTYLIACRAEYMTARALKDLKKARQEACL